MKDFRRHHDGLIRNKTPASPVKLFAGKVSILKRNRCFDPGLKFHNSISALI